MQISFNDLRVQERPVAHSNPRKKNTKAKETNKKTKQAKATKKKKTNPNTETKPTIKTKTKTTVTTPNPTKQSTASVNSSVEGPEDLLATLVEQKLEAGVGGDATSLFTAVYNTHAYLIDACGGRSRAMRAIRRVLDPGLTMRAIAGQSPV